MSGSGVSALLARVRVAWDEAERSGDLAGVSVRDRLDGVECREDGFSWSLWGAVNGNTSAMFTAACCYRGGVGTRRDRVQAVRWYLALFARGDGDAVHEAVEVVKQGMTDAQILEAGRLSGQALEARSLTQSAPSEQRRRQRRRPWR